MNVWDYSYMKMESQLEDGLWTMKRKLYEDLKMMLVIVILKI